MPNLVQLRDAHIATDHSVTRERAIEIQNTVYRARIRDVRYKDYCDKVTTEIPKWQFQEEKQKVTQGVSLNTLANLESLLMFKDYFTDAELDIILKFAKPRQIRKNSRIPNVKMSKAHREQSRKIRKARREMLYAELYVKGL